MRRPQNLKKTPPGSDKTAVASKQVGYFFKVLWPLQKSWTLSSPRFLTQVLWNYGITLYFLCHNWMGIQMMYSTVLYYWVLLCLVSEQSGSTEIHTWMNVSFGCTYTCITPLENAENWEIKNRNYILKSCPIERMT